MSTFPFLFDHQKHFNGKMDATFLLLLIFFASFYIKYFLTTFFWFVSEIYGIFLVGFKTYLKKWLPFTLLFSLSKILYSSITSPLSISSSVFSGYGLFAYNAAYGFYFIINFFLFGLFLFWFDLVLRYLISNLQ